MRLYVIMLVSQIWWSTNALEPNNTVILLPGYMGNQLNYSPRMTCMCLPSSRTLWFDIFKFILCPDKWVEYAKLYYSPETKTSYGKPGITVTVPPFGSTESMEYIAPFPQWVEMTSYFVKLVRCLEAKGYRKGHHLFGAPRDWRKSPHELGDYFAKLRALVESSYTKTGKCVVLIGHSMGGNLAYLFLVNQDKEWKDKYICRLITVGTRLGGGFKNWYGYLYRGDYPANMFPKIRDAERTFPAYTYLLPVKDTWSDSVFISTKSKNYTVDDLEEFFDKIGNKVAYQMYLDSHSMDPDGLPHPEVDVSCIGGLLPESTLRGLVYDSDDFNSEPKVIYGDGDTYVNIEALQRCTSWNLPQSGYKLFATDHLGLIRNAESVNYICEAASM